MLRNLHTAVAAAVTDVARKRLIRDLSASDMEIACMCTDGPSTLRALAKYRPDLLAADLYLPGLDGISLAQRVLHGFHCPVRPAVLLLERKPFPLSGRMNPEELGARFLAEDAPPKAAHTAIDSLRHAEFRFHPSEVALADRIMDDLGFPVHPGRDLLRLAALHCAADDRLLFNLAGRLYPMIGKIHSMNASQAERAMRHAVALAWQSDKFDNQNRIFADTVDAGRDLPTCGEMISRLADILRLEG